jgi:hypothetical protein
MNESLLAKPEITGVKPVVVEVTKSTPIGLGMERKKIIRGKVIGNSGKTKNVSLIERTPYNEVALNKLLHNWRIARDSGLPVPPTIRLSDRNTILVTDISADGSYIFGKSFTARNINVVAGELEEILEKENRFFQVWNRDKEEIVLAAHQLALDASNAGVLLPSDDAFELIVKPDQSWKLMILDIKLLRLFDKHDELAYKEAIELNKINIEFILGILDDIFQNLRDR